MSILASKTVRLLSLGFPVLDDVFLGFGPGDFAVLCGNAASFVSFLLLVRSQFPSECGGLDSPAIFVDGGNSFDPYMIADIARGYGLDAREVLEKIQVSRAFTAYQLSSLILEKTCSALRKNMIRLLVVSNISTLFFDRDIPKTEAGELFMRVCSKLSRIASDAETVVVATYSPETLSRQGLFFDAVLFGICNVSVRLRRRGDGLGFALEDHPRIKPFSMDLALEHPSFQSSWRA